MPAFDQQLAQRAQTDPTAFAKLYDQYMPRLYAYARRQTDDTATAEEITAITFEKALRHLQQKKWRGDSFLAWLYRLARNEIISQHRREKVRQLFRLKAQPTPPNAHERLPEQWVQFGERQAVVRQAMANLSKRDHDLLTLRFVEELSPAEIAEILGVPARLVSQRTHRALDRLRQHLTLNEVKAHVPA